MLSMRVQEYLQKQNLKFIRKTNQNLSLAKNLKIGIFHW